MEKTNGLSGWLRKEFSEDGADESFFGGERWAIWHNQEIWLVPGGIYSDMGPQSSPAKTDALTQQ